MTDREYASKVEADVWDALPWRILPILVILLVISCFLPGCGIIKSDPDYLHGPKATFDQHERTSGGA